MAFDNLLLRQCSYFYNENDTASETDGVTSVTKDIGNGSNTCIKIPLDKLNTVWNSNVSYSAQVEVFFQPKFMGDSSGNLTTTEILATIPVEMRQGIFRLPRFFGEGADQKTVYFAEKDTEANINLFIDATIVGGLTKTTRPDGTSILGYPSTDGTASPVTLTFPTPTADTAGTREYTVKRLTHSISDFVTYQPGGQLTSNLLNFQKGQEMFLIQELLWTIEMDMITFTDLAGKGKIVTTLGDGYIDNRDINLSWNELNDVLDTFTRTENKQVAYRSSVDAEWDTRLTNEIVNVEDLINYTETDPLTNGHVITWDNAAEYWTNKSVSDAAGSCLPVLAENLKFCGSGAHTTLLTDTFKAGDTYSSDDAILMTASGMSTVIFNDLKNVSYTEGSLNNNDILKWDDGNSRWIAGSISAAAGPAGGDTFKFQLKTTTTPASGAFIMENSSGADTTTWADVVKITLSTTDANGLNVSNWVESMDDGVTVNTVKGRIKVFNETTLTEFALFNVTSVSGNAITVAPITNAVAGSVLSADDYAYISFVMSGDNGEKGTDGTPGAAGADGPQGFQGKYFTSGAGAVSGDDINITWQEFNPATGATGAWVGNPLVISDFNDVADTGLYYIVSSAISGTTGYGRWVYGLATSSGGSASVFALNGLEETNTGSGGSTRTFQGYQYASPTGAVSGYDDRQLGKNPINSDTMALLPITTGTRIFAKTIASVSFGGQSVTKIISAQNAIVTVVCG